MNNFRKRHIEIPLIETRPRDMSQEPINASQELQKFINALHAICPSRSTFAQYLLLLPKNYPLLYDMFPEFLTDQEYRDNLGIALGLDYGSQIRCLPTQLGYCLRDFVSRLFDLMEKPEVRNSFCKILGLSDDALFNPRLEWIRARIEAVKSDDKDGPAIQKILRILALTEEPYPHWRATDDLEKKAELPRESYNRSLRFCQELYFIQSESHNGSGYVLSLELRKYISTLKECLGI
jgi:hypothetical protein